MSRKNKYKHMCIVDIESSCWENEDGSKTPPPGQQSEIIEIGICLLEDKQ